MLDSLYEANKVKVVLRSNDYDFSQTLMLHAYDEQSAEYGLRSDKLELQTGEYTVVGFYLYDRAEKEPIFAGIPSEKTTFTIVSGGLVVQDLLVDAIGRGLVKFELIKISNLVVQVIPTPIRLAILIRWILRFRTWIPKDARV